jgi:hypothetical protein
VNNDFESSSTSGDEEQSSEDSQEILRRRSISRNQERLTTATPQYSPTTVNMGAYNFPAGFNQFPQPDSRLFATSQNQGLGSGAVSLAIPNSFCDEQSDEDETVNSGAPLIHSTFVNEKKIDGQDIPLLEVRRRDDKGKQEVDDEPSPIIVQRDGASSDEEPAPRQKAQELLINQRGVESTTLAMLEVPVLIPVDNTPHNSDFIDEAYTTISTVIPEYPELSGRDMVVLAVALVSGAGASIYNYQFATKFLALVAKDLHWSKEFTDFARTLSGIANISVNVPIYTRSIIAFEGKYREDIAGRLKKDRINLSNDKKVMRSLYLYMFVGLAASAANLVFASESFSYTNLFSLANLAVIGAVVFQFLTAPPLNFQSIINLVELDPLRHENVQKRKFTFFKMLRDGMSPDVANQFPDNILEAMSKGQLTKPTGLPLWIRKCIGLIYAASSAPYSAAFGYSVFYRLSTNWLTVQSRDLMISHFRSLTTVNLPTVSGAFSYLPSIIPAMLQRVSQVFSYMPSMMPTSLQRLPEMGLSTAVNLTKVMPTTPHVEIALTVKDVTLGIAISGLTVLGGGLKFLLLSYFNYILMQAILSSRDETLFRYHGYSIEVSALRGAPSTIFKLILLLVFCAFVVFLSIGSASEVPEKYFWHDIGGITLLYSALIGIFAAFALNLRSFNYAIDAGVDRAKSAWWLKWLFPNHDRLARFGNDNNQFRLRAIFNLARMSDTNFDRFQSAFSTNSDQLLQEETGLRDVGLTLETEDLVGDLQDRDIHAEGHASSASGREFVRALTHLRDHGNPSFFNAWKEKYGKDSGARPLAPAQAEGSADTLISLHNDDDDVEQVPSALQPRRGMLDNIDEKERDLSTEEFYGDDADDLGARF